MNTNTINSIRFQMNHGSEKLPKDMVRRYDLHANGEEDPVLRLCLGKKHLRGTTSFLDADENPVAELVCIPGLLGASWRLKVKDEGEVASLSSCGLLKSGMTAKHGKTVYAIGDARSFKRQVLENSLNGWPDSYVCIVQDQPIGVLTRRPRCGEPRKSGFLGKVKSLFTDHDWVLELDDPLPITGFLIVTSLALATIELTVPVHRS